MGGGTEMWGRGVGPGDRPGVEIGERIRRG